ncbi:MAG: phospho-sugar mutase [Firmicutes bacterium]|nr:phospho-sugar mutase [Bacillota bacterium]
MCNELYRLWLETSDQETQKQIKAMTKEERIDAFGSYPSFGTGGIRKKEGIGPNRINPITIRWAAAAVANTLPQGSKVLIGYDTRHNSRAYAWETALTLNARHITTVLLEEPIPVPLLSFVLKRGGYSCGIMITASHNDAAYNGFKVYNRQGGQLIPEEAAVLEREMAKIDPFSIHPLSPSQAKERGLLFFTGKAETQAYLTAIAPFRYTPSDLSVAVTPLHGGGYKLLPEALRRKRYDLHVVSEQAKPDGNFPTVKAPNPEDPGVFDLAANLGKKIHADLLLATDGDGDRCGCCVRKDESYIPLSGNDAAAILMHYLIHREKDHLPPNGFIVRTAVSGTIAAAIAETAGLKTYITPTGFKYIGALANDPAKGTFFAGYEESGGFLFGNHAADKDGIQTAVLLAEAAAFYKKNNQTLLDVLAQIGKTYGREYTATKSYAFEKTDLKNDCMENFKKHSFPKVLKEIRDDTVFFEFGNGIKTALRPSGTEPCIKRYSIIRAEHPREATEKEKILSAFFDPIFHRFLVNQTKEC